jgi:hypothetical protein
MRRISSLLLAALLILGFSQRAQADFIYTFTGTIPVVGGTSGTVSVTIDAPDSAVASGVILAGNITSLTLAVTGTTFNPAMGSLLFDFTSTDKNDLLGGFPVNATGAFTAFTPSVMASASMTFIDPFSETVTIFPAAATPPFTATFTISSTDTNTDLTDMRTGTGNWSVSQQVAGVPAPSSFVLAGVGGFLVLAITLRRRQRSQEAPATTT